jgi:hypothetical protein
MKKKSKPRDHMVRAPRPIKSTSSTSPAEKPRQGRGRRGEHAKRRERGREGERGEGGREGPLALFCAFRGCVPGLSQAELTHDVRAWGLQKQLGLQGEVWDLHGV